MHKNINIRDSIISKNALTPYPSRINGSESIWESDFGILISNSSRSVFLSACWKLGFLVQHENRLKIPRNGRMSSISAFLRNGCMSSIYMMQWLICYLVNLSGFSNWFSAFYTSWVYGPGSGFLAVGSPSRGSWIPRLSLIISLLFILFKEIKTKKILNW